MKVVLFALTGFGNETIDILLECGCQISVLFTRHEQGEYPYYPEKNISEYALEKNIVVYEKYTWEEVENILTILKSDLLLVSTFHRIIPQRVVTKSKKAVNVHPSLLPKYKGRTPIAAVMSARETETGITVHVLTDKVDDGRILLQQKIRIEPEETEGMLRKRLTKLSGKMIKYLIKGNKI